MTPLDFVSAVNLPLQTLGAVQYFGPEAKVAAEALGIDGFRFYFAGRGGVLGEVSTPVLLSAFGYFNPELVSKMWSSSKERCDVVEAGAAQLRVAYEIGDKHLAEVDGLAEAAANMALLTGSVDVSALPMFAGFAATPIPGTPTHAFMHQAILFRELRGSIHLAAVAASGCRSRVAHQLRRPNELEMFGYTEEIEVSQTERDAFDNAEPLTEAAMAVHADTWLTDPQRTQIAATVASAHRAIE